MKKAYIDELDYLRAFAFLAVVLQHSIGHYIFDPASGLADSVAFTFLLLISKFAVPMFIFITGLVLFYNYDGKLHYGSFLKKRFMDIMIPYMFWAFAHLLYQNKDFLLAIQKFGDVVFTGKASYHLWYVIMVIQLYITFPIYRYLFMKARNWINKPATVYITLGLLGLVYMLIMFYPIHRTAEQWNLTWITPILTKYADRNALNFLYYFILGAVAGLAITQWREWLNRNARWVYGSFIIMFSYMAYRVISSFEMLPTFKTDYSQLLLLRPAMAVFLVTSVLAMYVFGMRYRQVASARTHRTIKFISHHSYGAYLMHALMLVTAYLLPDFLAEHLNVTMRTLLAFVIASVLSVLGTYLLTKLPFGHIMTGLKRKKKQAVTPAATVASSAAMGNTSMKG